MNLCYIASSMVQAYAIASKDHEGMKFAMQVFLLISRNHIIGVRWVSSGSDGEKGE